MFYCFITYIHLANNKCNYDLISEYIPDIEVSQENFLGNYSCEDISLFCCGEMHNDR